MSAAPHVRLRESRVSYILERMSPDTALSQVGRYYDFLTAHGHWPGQVRYDGLGQRTECGTCKSAEVVSEALEWPVAPPRPEYRRLEAIEPKYRSGNTLRTAGPAIRSSAKH
jgi:hypothetical protein